MNFSFENALNEKMSESGQTVGELQRLFDLDSNVTSDQIKNMVEFLQVSCSKEGLPTPLKFREDLVYEVVGYDEFIRKSIRQKGFKIKERNIGDKANISEVIQNLDSFRDQGFAPKTVVDGQGCRWSL